jgi:hypothetical protein
MNEWVRIIGGMIRTVDFKVLEEKLYSSSVVVE